MAINISTSRRIFRWRPACWLRVSGSDASSFLQGQFTNDLRLLESATSVYGLWLTLKGKVLADSFVLRGNATDEFWIGSYFSPAATIHERLESHVIADDVEVADETAAWAGTSLLGDFPAPPTMGQSSASFQFPGRRDQGPNREWVYRVADGEPSEISAWGGSAVDDQEMARRRIAAGIPAVPIDLGLGDLPNEAGLEAEAISYTKGCYLGQEVMARLKSMGQVRRRLCRVRGEGGRWPALPAPIFVAARQVGELRSAAGDGATGWIGLAMVTLMHVSPDAHLSFAAGSSPALRLISLP
jgi:tRNA-modifying protein YgfZ